MRKTKLLLAIVIMLFLVGCTNTTDNESDRKKDKAIVDSTGEKTIVIDSSIFPDEYFRKYVENNIDLNKDGALSQEEIDKVDIIYAHGGEKKLYDNLSSLKGVELFSNLKELECYETELYEIDLSRLTKLEVLEIGNTKVDKLDISSCNELKVLKCNDTKLSEINVSSNNNLEVIDIMNTDIGSIDLSNNTNLKKFNCSGSRIDRLDFSKNKDLKEIICFDTGIESIDITNNIELVKISVSSTNISELDLSSNNNIMHLNCENCSQIKNLNVDNLIHLQELNIQGTQITEIDLSQSDEIINIGCNMDTNIIGADEGIIRRY